MSEPNAAFFSVPIDRAPLVRWLDARPQPASQWTDWREIGGQWYIGQGGANHLSDASDAVLASTLALCDRMLSNLANNREAVQSLISFDANMLYGRAFHDPTAQSFLAGQLIYGEGLTETIVFLAVARSIANALAPGAAGMAVVHDYAFGNGTVAALRIGPDSKSAILSESEHEAAVETFQALADSMLGDEEQARTIDELDALR